jgi:hypothetical protein
MVQHLDPHELACLAQAAGDGDVLTAGGRIAGGVVVDQDQRGGGFLDGRAEYLAGVDDALVE